MQWHLPILAFLNAQIWLLHHDSQVPIIDQFSQPLSFSEGGCTGLKSLESNVQDAGRDNTHGTLLLWLHVYTLHSNAVEGCSTS